MIKRIASLNNVEIELQGIKINGDAVKQKDLPIGEVFIG